MKMTLLSGGDEIWTTKRAVNVLAEYKLVERACPILTLPNVIFNNLRSEGKAKIDVTCYLEGGQQDNKRAPSINRLIFTSKSHSIFPSGICDLWARGPFYDQGILFAISPICYMGVNFPSGLRKRTSVRAPSGQIVSQKKRGHIRTKSCVSSTQPLR